MMCEYISIAVSHILSEHKNGIERCCGSCNPSCGDLTRFICFGHSMKEIEEWLDKNRELAQSEYESMFNSIDYPTEEENIQIEIVPNEEEFNF